MYKKRLLLSVACISLGFTTFGQSLGTRVTNAKVEIIKRTLEFLTTDTTKGRRFKSNSCSFCKDFNDLIDFAQVNNIPGGLELIKKWQPVAIDTTDEQLASQGVSDFAQRIGASVTTGNKAFREQLLSYPQYHDQMSQYQLSTGNPEENSEVAVDKDSPKDVNAENHQVHQSKSEAPQQHWFFSPLSVYVQSAMILILVFALLSSKLIQGRKIKKYTKDLSRIRSEREAFKFEKENLLSELAELKVQRQEDQSQLELLKEEQLQSEDKQTTETQIPPNMMVWDKPEAPKKSQEVFYSRYADLLDGFSAAELLPEEGNDTIFEITLLSTTQATFRVTTNPAAQKYALSNADYFLERTCHYDTRPGGQIINELPGQLSLSGNKWAITKQARISFQ